MPQLEQKCWGLRWPVRIELLFMWSSVLHTLPTSPVIIVIKETLRNGCLSVCVLCIISSSYTETSERMDSWVGSALWRVGAFVPHWILYVSHPQKVMVVKKLTSDYSSRFSFQIPLKTVLVFLFQTLMARESEQWKWNVVDSKSGNMEFITVLGWIMHLAINATKTALKKKKKFSRVNSPTSCPVFPG